MNAVIIGAGPVGCILAVGLRRRSVDVTIYDKHDDPRLSHFDQGHSFNLTLSLRGLTALDPQLRELLETKGVRLSQRVIHRIDGTVIVQPYGISEEHYLLSIPRRIVHTTFVEAAQSAGAHIHFGWKCIRADPVRASATFLAGSRVIEDCASLLVGCDGANSVVRRELANSVGLRISEEACDLAYVELKTGSDCQSPHALEVPAPMTGSAGTHYGLHIWPRRHFMMLAQPNVDGSYTFTLFLPLTSNEGSIPSFERLVSEAEVLQFFRTNFPDLLNRFPLLAEEFHARPPAQLKTVRSSAFHYERTMLIGDAAHAMLPFFGQGINCSFEDVRVVLDCLDENLHPNEIHNGVSKALSEYTAARKPQCDAITNLSQENLEELMTYTTDCRFQARARIERELYRRDPARFLPLYCGVAFSTIPYQVVMNEYSRRRARLDALCETFDVETEAEKIIEQYSATTTDEVLPEEPSELELSPNQTREFIDRTVARILRYQADLASSKYPASYVHDSIDVSAYEQGLQVSAALREDEIPSIGVNVDLLLSEIFDQAFPSGTVHPHPGFMAHIPSGGLFQGAVGDFIARTLNRFPGVWVAAPGLIQIECNVIRWFCSLLGYDENSFGYLTTSGSIANLMGLMCACRGDGASTRAVVYVSAQGHFSVQKAARLVGITDERLRIIRTRLDYAMDVDHLVRQIGLDRKQGLHPSCVVGTAGTTNTGAVDDLVAVAEVCRKEGLRFHVDACFGGFFRITSRGRAALLGIEEADSIAVDPHKALFLPHGASALLVKDRAYLLNTFEIPKADYVPVSPAHSDLVNFCDYGPELSREIRGLTAWLPIKMHGITAFERCLDQKLDLAIYLAAELERIPDIEVVRRHPIRFSVVTFQLQTASGRDQQDLNRRLCELVCSRGHVYITTTVLPEYGLVLRACILNHRTDRATVDQLIADIRSVIPSLETH